MTEKELEILNRDFNNAYTKLYLSFKNGEISNERALELIEQNSVAMEFDWAHLNPDQRLLDLIDKYDDKYDELKTEVIKKMHSAYLLKTKDRTIVCTNENLLNKCRARLTNVEHSVETIEICSSEKDVDILLPIEDDSALVTITYNGWGTETHM